MKKEIICWKMELESLFFEGQHITLNGTLYAEREDAVKDVEQLREYLNKHYLNNEDNQMGRKLIHEQLMNKKTGIFDDAYYYRLVVVDKYDNPHLVEFGCKRNVIRLR